MNEKNEYCTGCGLCNGIYKNDVNKKNEDGFDYFYTTKENMKFLKENICISSGIQTMDYCGEIWGKSNQTYFSFAQKDIIRHNGSSGGTLTALACYLLDKGIVDGVLTLSLKANEATKYEYIIVTNSEEMISHTGSRYIDTNNLINVLDLVQEGKKYCFIGKPCDVITLKNYSKINKIIKDSIIFYLSFFCAGAPSENATYKLAKSLGCNNEISSIIYRGNGWPGYTIIKDVEGKEYTTTYDNSWGNYLGRSIRKCCRFCLDGIGEAADIACADAWYIKDGNPDFSEHEGRNISFIRSKIGEDIFYNAIQEGYLDGERINEFEEYLSVIQKYQLQRRATMNTVFKALKLFGREVPNYDRRLMKRYSKKSSFKLRFKRYIGTVKRVIKHKI